MCNDAFSSVQTGHNVLQRTLIEQNIVGHAKTKKNVFTGTAEIVISSKRLIPISPYVRFSRGMNT